MRNERASGNGDPRSGGAVDSNNVDVSALLVRAAAERLVATRRPTPLRLDDDEHRRHVDGGGGWEERISDAIDAVKRWIPRLTRLLSLLVVLQTVTVTSVVLYGAFYLSVMPTDYAAREAVHLDYDVDLDRQCAGDGGGEGSGDDVRSPPWSLLFNDGACSSSSSLLPPPTALVDLTSRHGAWTARAEGVAPPGRGERPLTPRGRYFVRLSLVLPASERNAETGTFVARVDLYDGEGQRLASSARSASLPHESELVGTVRRTLLLPALLIGAAREDRTVRLDLFDHFTELEDRPLSFVKVRITTPGHHRRDSSSSWSTTMTTTTVSARTVQVTSSELLIGKEMSALQTILHDRFYACAVVGVFLIMWIEAISILSARAAYRALKECARAGREASEERRRRRGRRQRQRRDERRNDEDCHATRRETVGDVFAEPLRETTARPETARWWREELEEHDMGDDGDSDEGCWESASSVNDDDATDVDDQSPVMNDEKPVENKVKSASKSNDKESEQKEKSEVETTRQPELTTEESEKVLVDRVMRGLTEPYEIFTDLDDPDI